MVLSRASVLDLAAAHTDAHTPPRHTHAHSHAHMDTQPFAPTSSPTKGPCSEPSVLRARNTSVHISQAGTFGVSAHLKGRQVLLQNDGQSMVVVRPLLGTKGNLGQGMDGW
jgi:hypothetical protein